MPDEKVTLKIQLGNFAAEVSGTADYAESTLEKLLEKYGPSRTAGQSFTGTPATAATGKSLSPSEFIKKIAPKNQSEKALVLSHYLEKYKGMESFSTSDLTEIAKEARQSRFTNISDTVAKLVQQGLLMGAGEKENKQRVFVLTTTGEELVENFSQKVNKE